jgi:dolichyl-phosphate beta-glucosyltransferase
VVDDGSKDGTASLVQDRYVLAQTSERVRLLRLHANSGKGAAVRKGVARARGEYILMADADGATRFSDVDWLLEAVGPVIDASGRGVAIGSRAHMEEGEGEADAAAAAAPGGSASADASAADAGGGDATAPAPAAVGTGGRARRSGVRKLLMWGFHTLLTAIVGGHGIRDTQCGFKLFTRAAARQLFLPLHIERWAFDVELVYLAARKGIPMVVSGGGEAGPHLIGGARPRPQEAACVAAGPFVGPRVNPPPPVLLPLAARRRCP